MIYLFYNSQRLTQIPEKEEKEFLASEDFMFWKKNCIESEIHDSKVIRPQVTSYYKGIEYTHVVELIEVNRVIQHRIPGQEALPSEELKLVKRKFVTRAG